MLARIADLAPDAATDHSGGRLRFADRGQLAQIRTRLTELGYESAELAGADYGAALTAEWYAPAALSREEARVLASTMVPAFIAEQALAPVFAEALRTQVESALFGCFTTSTIGSGALSGSLRAQCADAVASAATELLGAEASRALREFVDRWLFRT